ncbi:glycosyltransferase family 2 protein [Leptolyngbya sp. FACHB-261]|uniref:glycosyltransferase family 2 protein n=1 Tax=Leptolyngbya sp. FACHB-261 TaxID=2692806 RepID=UPI00168572E7|nr:glycosyltransferase [Leptolyngbya sp. FACHB-261]MBD2101739.1 glycosyltransferase [Leptolyngbya sp. FACHB-261]
MFGVTVNHFHKQNYPASVKKSTEFSLALLKNCPEVTSIILVDGSTEQDLELKNYCESLGVIYKHAGRLMSFAEAYNYGASFLKEDWITTMASDIYVYPDTFSKFKEFIEKHKHLSIGCLIPYLSTSDFPVQQTSQTARRHNCYASVMTFNLNIFPKHVFKSIGGLSTKYTGNFNDIKASLELQRLGLEIFLVDVYVQHYGSLTLRHGSNASSSQHDKERFYLEHPELTCEGGLWNLRLDYFFRSPIIKYIYRLSSNIRNRNVRERLIGLGGWVYRFVPRLQRIDS